MYLVDEPPAQAREVDRLVEVVRCAFARESQGQGVEVSAPDPDLEGLDAPAFVHAVKLQRVEQLLAAHARELGLPAEVVSGVQALAASEAAEAMTLALETTRAWATLTGAGIRAVAFKGVALSVQTTGAVTARGSGDIDLLVDPRDVIAAHHVLAEAGWQPWRATALTEAWWPWLETLTREVPLTGERASIDLHWRIASEPRFLPPPSEVLDRAVTLEVMGRPLRVLGADDALAAACYTFQYDRFSSLRLALDVVRLLRQRTAPARFPRRVQAMVEESCAAAAALVGGITPAHVTALGLPAPEMSRGAAAEWRRRRSHPHTAPPTARPILNLGAALRVQRFSTPVASLYRTALSRTIARDDLRPPGPPSRGALHWATVKSVPALLRRRH